MRSAHSNESFRTCTIAFLAEVKESFTLKQNMADMPMVDMLLSFHLNIILNYWFVLKHYFNHKTYKPRLSLLRQPPITFIITEINHRNKAYLARNKTYSFVFVNETSNLYIKQNLVEIK